MTVKMPRPPLHLAYVSYGKADDKMFASGIPYYLRQGFEQIEGVRVTEISTRPSRLMRLVIKGASFRPNRTSWERNYLHGRILPLARSFKRTRAIRAQKKFDAALHVRTWYSALKDLPYATFIDATVSQVRGYDPSWDLSDTQFQHEVRVEGDFYRQATAIYTASYAAIDSLVNDYGVDRSRIVRVGAGTTLPGIESLSEEQISSRFSNPNLLFVGKDPDRKGLPELIEAFHALREDRPELTLTIVGPSEPRDEYSAPGIVWHGLVSDKDELQRYYNDATIFFLPAHRESFGLVVPEAMAYGLPCIVSSTGELPHLVQHGKSGEVLPEISGTAIAAAVRRSLGSRVEYEKLAVSAHAASHQYDWTAIARVISDDLASRL